MSYLDTHICIGIIIVHISCVVFHKFSFTHFFSFHVMFLSYAQQVRAFLFFYSESTLHYFDGVI